MFAAGPGRTVAVADEPTPDALAAWRRAMLFIDLDHFNILNDTKRPRRGRSVADPGGGPVAVLYALRRQCRKAGRRRIQCLQVTQAFVLRLVRISAGKPIEEALFQEK